MKRHVENAKQSPAKKECLTGENMWFGPKNTFLSTFYMHPLDMKDDERYFSVEHFYQCEKYNHGMQFPNPETREYYQLLRACDTNMKAVALGCMKKHRFSSTWYVSKTHKHLGTIDECIDRYRGKVSRVEHWHSRNVEVMTRAQRRKFSQPKLAKLLKSTVGHSLRYMQPSGEFWSYASRAGEDVPRTGENMLGSILESIREEIGKKK